MSETPDLKKLEHTLKAMTPEQFTAVCAELGLVEDLLGATRDEQIKTLLAMSPNLGRVARTVRHVWPEAFEPPPVKPKREIKLPIGPVVGFLGLIAIIATGVWIVNSALNANATEVINYRVTSSPVPTQAMIIGLRTATFTPTPTETPTRTPTNTPDVPGTLTATYAPTATPTETPTRTATPTRTRRASATPGPTSDKPTRTSTATASPAPAVRIVYPAPILNRPASNTIIEGTKAFQMRWIVPGLTELNPDERYRLRLRLDQQVVYDYSTANNWYDSPGAPNGAPGTYNWSVMIVKVDDAGNVIGVLSPESERWNIIWQ
jgi:hypothetical protein